MPNVKADNIDNIESITSIKKTISNDNEDQEIPPAIEDIIEQLIQGLRDKAITIRYIDAVSYMSFIRDDNKLYNYIHTCTHAHKHMRYTPNWAICVVHLE